MPPHPQRDKALSFTIIGVSALSTIAMVVYPLIARAAGLDPAQAGIFLGGSIHDVAQVVGAGYSMSTQIGDTATVVKLLRVAMLLPVIALTVVLMRGPGITDQAGAQPRAAARAAALVRHRVRGAGSHQQPGLDSQTGRAGRQRAVELVPGAFDGCDRREDADQGTGERGPAADRPDDQRVSVLLVHRA